MSSFKNTVNASAIMMIIISVLAGCQKGDDSVNTAITIANLHIRNFDASQWDLRYNGEPVSRANSGGFDYKVLGGKAKLSLINKETTTVGFEGEFDISTKDTLFFLQPMPDRATMIRNTQVEEPAPREGYIKVKIMDFTGLAPDGEGVNLEFRQVIDYNWETFEPIYAEERDTLFGVTSAMPDQHQEIHVQYLPFSEGNFGSYEVKFLGADNQPLLKDGVPIIVPLLAEGHMAGSSYVYGGIYTSYVSENDIWFADTHWTGQFINLFLN